MEFQLPQNIESNPRGKGIIIKSNSFKKRVKKKEKIEYTYSIEIK